MVKNINKVFLPKIKGSFTTQVIFSIAISYAGFAAAFVSSVVIARMLGVEGKGLFTLFTVSISTITIFSGFGVGHGQMYRASRFPEEIGHFMPNGFVTSVAFGGGGALFFILMARFFHLRIGEQLGLPLTIGIVLFVPVLSSLVFQRQFLLAIHAYQWSKLNYCLAQFLPLPIYILLYLTDRITVQKAIVAFLFCQLAVFLLFQIVILKIAPRDNGFSLDFARRSISFGIRQYLSDVVLYLTSRLDFFLVTIFIGKSGLGLYSVAVSLAEVVMRVPSELGTILFPAFASSRVTRQDKIFLLRITVLLSVLCAIGLALTGWILIQFLFGSRFKGSIPAFYWLLPGIVAWSTIYVTWNNVSAGGSPGWGIPVFGSAALLDSLLNVLLLPRIGVVGAAIASTISYWFAAIFFIGLFCRKEKCSVGEALLVRGLDIQKLMTSITTMMGGFQTCANLRGESSTSQE